MVSLQLREEKSLLRGSEDFSFGGLFHMVGKVCSGSTGSKLQAGTYGCLHGQMEGEEKLR